MELVTDAIRVRERVLTERMLLWLTLGFFITSNVGAHVDAWYHVHYGFAIESFFTWPHALFYAGRTGMTILLAIYLLESAALRKPRRSWLPAGFPLILFSTVVFVAGGAFDLGWHTLFGFEADLATLLSPAHLWLNVAAILAALGLIQAGLASRRLHGRLAYQPRIADVPVVIGTGILFRVTLWTLFYSDPLAVDYASAGPLARRLSAYADIPWNTMATQVAGTTGIVAHALLLALFLLLVSRWLRLPGGAVAVVMLWDGVLTAMVTDSWLYLPAVVGGAAAGEATWAGLWRGRLGGLDGERGYWLLAGVVPVVQFFGYFAIMHAFGGGISWMTHLWVGAPLLAGFFAVIASLLVVPPRFIRHALDSRS
jgi:hypothetical protein